MQVVSQLEIHLQKERDRLQAMMHHLYLAKQKTPSADSGKGENKVNKVVLLTLNVLPILYERSHYCRKMLVNIYQVHQQYKYPIRCLPCPFVLQC